MYHYNDTQYNEQFLPVSLLDCALISLGLALYRLSACVSSVFMCCVYLKFFVTFLSLLFSELSLVGLAFNLVDWPSSFSAATLFVGSSDCKFVHKMTYNVSSGTLDAVYIHLIGVQHCYHTLYTVNVCCVTDRPREESVIAGSADGDP